MSLDNLIGQLRTSSISDTGVYRGVCAAAAEHQQVFDEFRRLPGYTRILEHVTEAQGQAYLDEIRRLAPHALRDPSWFMVNDKYGNPVRFDYGFGPVSPTTLRYVKVAIELQSLFMPALKDAHVIEVGGGYGGQARIIRAMLPAVRYTIIDLPEPLALAKRYLSAYDTRVELVDGTQYPHIKDPPPWDLFLSNYALTECAPPILARYCIIAQRCRMGYVTGNAQEKRLFELLTPCRRLDEVPLTGPGNFVCVWP